VTGTLLVGLGILIGLIGSSFAQRAPSPGGHMRGLNQVGIVVKDYKAAMDFYTQKLGIAEAYTIRRPDGIPQNRSDGVWTGIFAT